MKKTTEHDQRNQERDKQKQILLEKTQNTDASVNETNSAKPSVQGNQPQGDKHE